MYKGKAFCATHLLGRIEIGRLGTWYEQCTHGRHNYEKCDLRKEDGSPLFGGGEKKQSSDNS